MKEKIQKAIVFLIIFMLSFALIKYIVNATDIPSKLPEKEAKLLLQAIQWIASFILANIINIARLAFERQQFHRQNMPKLHLLTGEVTDTKRMKRKDGLPQIQIGQGKYFVYVRVRMINTGEGFIEKCKIADTELHDLRLGKNEESQFYLRIHKADEEGKLKDFYRIKTVFEDAEERVYTKVLDLRVDEDHAKAAFKVYRKQKRRFYSNGATNEKNQ